MRLKRHENLAGQCLNSPNHVVHAGPRSFHSGSCVDHPGESVALAKNTRKHHVPEGENTCIPGEFWRALRAVSITEGKVQMHFAMRRTVPATVSKPSKSR